MNPLARYTIPTKAGKQWGPGPESPISLTSGAAKFSTKQKATAARRGTAMDTSFSGEKLWMNSMISLLSVSNMG